MEHWELSAREAVRDLVARYNANGDAGRVAAVLDLFAEDAVMELVTEEGHSSEYRGTAEIASIFTGTGERWAAAADGPFHVRHCVTTHQIDLQDAAHATGRSYFMVLMPHGLDHWGRYLDRYEERAGRWVFTRRTVRTDGHRPDGMLGRGATEG